METGGVFSESYHSPKASETQSENNNNDNNDDTNSNLILPCREYQESSAGGISFKSNHTDKDLHDHLTKSSSTVSMNYQTERLSSEYYLDGDSCMEEDSLISSPVPTESVALSQPKPDELSRRKKLENKKWLEEPFRRGYTESEPEDPLCKQRGYPGSSKHINNVDVLSSSESRLEAANGMLIAAQSFPDLMLGSLDIDKNRSSLDSDDDSGSEVPECLRDFSHNYNSTNRKTSHERTCDNKDCVKKMSFDYQNLKELSFRDSSLKTELSVENHIISSKSSDLDLQADDEGDDLVVCEPRHEFKAISDMKPPSSGAMNEWAGLFRVALILGLPIIARNLGSLLCRLALRRIIVPP